jgi:hypothetical protein
MESPQFVMAGLDPAICCEWRVIPGSSLGMTMSG